MYDLIGDLHGHADELVALLERLDYRLRDGVYFHPERQVVYLGDYIDRGPKIQQVLEIVRSMVLAGSALAILGNHEWNALAYHSEDPHHPGEHLRRHTLKNIAQHRRTVEQLDAKSLSLYLDWFRTLPLWLDLGGLRAIHACWDQSSIDRIAPFLAAEGRITPRFLSNVCREKDLHQNDNPLFHAVEIILKGKEAPLPEGAVFHDKDGHERNLFRTRWYLSPDGHTYKSYALETALMACEQELDPGIVSSARPYPLSEKPVFIGHYWQEGTHPTLLADNVACLDYSVAKGGFLCAYRWNGEQRLSEQNFARAD